MIDYLPRRPKPAGRSAGIGALGALLSVFAELNGGSLKK